jgi:nucleoside-diphosphate-sugar epimerase
MAANPEEDRGVNASEILVTVGTGSLGRRVVNRLRGPGYEVRTLGRSTRGAGAVRHAGKHDRVREDVGGRL